MTFSTLRLELGGPVGSLTLNRPHRLNAMSNAMLEELIAAAAEIDGAGHVRAVVVAGEGRAFCAGYDLKEADAGRAADLGPRMAAAIEEVQAVTVAALHGHVVGGGVVLAAACDLRVAGEDTVFSIPEVDLGIPLGWGGVPRLVREIGPARTRDLVMTCRPFDAAEAHAMGFVNRMVPPGEHLAAATELAELVAAKPAPAVETTKRQVAAAARLADTTDADALLAALASPESQQAAEEYRRKLFGH